MVGQFFGSVGYFEKKTKKTKKTIQLGVWLVLAAESWSRREFFAAIGQ